jgi:hypothetical protein
MNKKFLIKIRNTGCAIHNALLKIISVSIILIFSGCQTYRNTIKIDTNIEYKNNKEAIILLETKEGCTQTKFKFKENYHKLESNKNLFTAYKIEELELLKNEYFELDFLNSIKPELFDDNIIVFFIKNFSDGTIFKNSRFEDENNTYVFVVDEWDNGKPILLRNKCVYTKLFILQIPK